jgi:hypothetical protein
MEKRGQKKNGVQEGKEEEKGGKRGEREELVWR